VGVLIPGQMLVWRAGLALIAAGIVCLYLSDQVVQGWWQGTLDAFGVGFIVGGVVDVLAISGLSQAITGEDKRRENNVEAEAILRADEWYGGPGVSYVESARDLLAKSGRHIDPQLRDRLQAMIDGEEPAA
jgi:hypothetical protein